MCKFSTRRTKFHDKSAQWIEFLRLPATTNGKWTAAFIVDSIHYVQTLKAAVRHFVRTVWLYVVRRFAGQMRDKLLSSALDRAV